MGRIPYIGRDELAPDEQSLLDTLSNETDEGTETDHSLRGGTLNVYRAMANNVALLEAFQAYGSTVWRESGLSPHEREFVILSVAYYSGSAYEWQQHVRVALNEGLAPEQICAISTREHDRLDEKDAALVQYVDNFVDGSVNDTVHERVSAYYDDDIVLGIGMLAGTYLGLSRLLDALDVDTEVEFVGWNLENL